MDGQASLMACFVGRTLARFCVSGPSDALSVCTAGRPTAACCRRHRRPVFATPPEAGSFTCFHHSLYLVPVENAESIAALRPQPKLYSPAACCAVDVLSACFNSHCTSQQWRRRPGHPPLFPCSCAASAHESPYSSREMRSAYRVVDNECSALMDGQASLMACFVGRTLARSVRVPNVCPQPWREVCLLDQEILHPRFEQTT